MSARWSAAVPLYLKHRSRTRSYNTIPWSTRTYSTSERTHEECSRTTYTVQFTSVSIRTTVSHGVRDRTARRSACRYESVPQSIRAYEVAQHEECRHGGVQQYQYTKSTVPVRDRDRTSRRSARRCESDSYVVMVPGSRHANGQKRPSKLHVLVHPSFGPGLGRRKGFPAVEQLVIIADNGDPFEVDRAGNLKVAHTHSNHRSIVPYSEQFLRKNGDEVQTCIRFSASFSSVYRVCVFLPSVWQFRSQKNALYTT